MRLTCSAFLGIGLQLCFLQATTQQIADSSTSPISAFILRNVYFNGIGDNAAIYHGREYIRNGQKAIGFPYYQSDNMLTGVLSYQGTLYPEQKIFFNLVTDEVIINNYAQNAQIILSSDKLDSLVIGQAVFIRKNANGQTGLNRDGFYERLSSGEPSLYALREKRLVVGSGSEETKYVSYNYYFLKRKDVYYAVAGKNELLGILTDQRDALKKYFRSNKLNFKKDLENSLVLSTVYYSRLNH